MAGEHILVVGGSRGLGKEFTTLAGAQGFQVSVVARSRRQDSGGGYYAFDLTQVSAIGSLLERIRQERGSLRHMVFFQRFRGDGDDWQGEWTTTLSATKEFIEKSHAAFDLTKPCSIVLVASVNAIFISEKLPCSYHLAKAGLCQLARFFAVALGSKNIRVNAVCPGTFVKPENEDFYRQNPDLYRRLAQASPLKRMGTARDVAHAIFFLLGDQASFITGQSLLVDGGMSLLWQETLLS